MKVQEDQAIYRIHRFSQDDGGSRATVHIESFEISDDRTEDVLARCDIIGQANMSPIEIIDKKNRIWQMKPNRTINPTGWNLTGPERRLAMRFEQKAAGKFINPIYKVVLVLRDWEENVKYRLVYPNKTISDMELEIKAGEYAVMAGGKPAAKLVWLPRQEIKASGFFETLKRIMTPSDRALVSAGPVHFLEAPAALAMYLCIANI